jgi:fumarate reductase flavoprotein subunit
MELGPRDRLSQAYWHEKQKGRTIDGPHGAVVHLDLRHLGEHKLRERLPQIYELAMHYLGVDPAREPIPVLPAVHYTMGGITADIHTAAPLPGLYSAGECSSVGIHGANRLGSNSLTELLVFGKVAGVEAARHAVDTQHGNPSALAALADAARERALAVVAPRDNGERIAALRREMAQSMEDGCGIYRSAATMQATCDKLAELKQRYRRVRVDDNSSGWNTERLLALELGYQLDVAQSMAHSALQRNESRGSHQRLDGYEQRDDVNYLQHSLAIFQGDDAPRIGYGPVKITRLPPGIRAYGEAGEHYDAVSHAEEAARA